MMKKYIAPEVEISKFTAEDIMTGSSPVVEPTAAIKYDSADPSYDFGSGATYGEF